MIASDRALTTAGSGAGAGAGAGAGGAFGAGTGGAGPDPDRATCRDPACASWPNARLPSARCKAYTRFTGAVAADSPGAALARAASRAVRRPVTPSGAMSGVLTRGGYAARRASGTIAAERPFGRPNAPPRCMEAGAAERLLRRLLAPDQLLESGL